MDNLTHSLVGLAAAKAGLEKLSPAATTLCIVAANAPDADIVVLAFGDRWDFLKHHRGITHAIVGTIALTLILPLLFLAIDWARSRLTRSALKVNLKGLLIASAVASITHPVLDWTNNYGIRFLLPFKPDWFYGDLVYIVDPFVWLIFGLACFLLTSRTRSQKLLWLLLGVATSAIVVASPRRGALEHPKMVSAFWLGALALAIVLSVRHVADRWTSKLAFGSFFIFILYLSSLQLAHHLAFARGEDTAAFITREKSEALVKLAVMPTLANPMRWDCVFETDRAIYRFPVSILSNEISDLVRYEKSPPGVDQAMRKLANEKEVSIFLGFARFPVAQLADPNCTTRTFVQLADLRYTEPGRSRGTFSLEVPIDCPVVLTDSK